MTKMTIAALALILLLPSLSVGYQVSIEASASKTEVSKGETFTYKLSIIEEGDADRPSRLVPPDFAGFNVTGSFSSSSIKIINSKARRVTDREFRLSSDTPGEHTIPPARLVLTDPAAGTEQTIPSNEVLVVVSEKEKGIIQGLKDDIRDIKEPKSFVDKVRLFFYSIAALLALLFLLLLGLALYMVRRKKNKQPVPVPEAPAPVYRPSARDEALAALGRASALKSDPKAFYSAVSEAVRVYLNRARGMATIEATTSEIMAGAADAGIPPDAEAALGALLNEADLAKFAKYRPSEPEMTRTLERARELVNTL